MSLVNTLTDIALEHPVMQAVISYVSELLHSIGKATEQGEVGSVVSKYVLSDVTLNSLFGSSYHFIRLAGLSGTSAILLGAYCGSVLEGIKDPLEHIRLVGYAEGASRIHFLHAFAMMAMPLAHNPVLTGTLMTTGTLIYSGSLYYCALTRKRRTRIYPTIGGFVLIAAWMSLLM
ncbi:transmembrane protein 256 homolog [Drosophila subobscura]|uniref:transmembrane protein 256 homolog n=1 Tax=Drosophila subobscura TaxID=7241 RepID=UPI00155ACBA7|nr:transmembrane protein 256 homolog [Drosophila subobscura]